MAAATLALPLVAALRHPAGWFTTLLVTVVFGATALSPPIGLLALIISLPLTPALERFSAVPLLPAGLTEMLLLAFCSASWLRSDHASGASRSRLSGPALVLAAAVVTSAICEFSALAATLPQQPQSLELWRHVTADYWQTMGPFGMVHHALRWLAGLTVAVATERILRVRPLWWATTFRAWLLAGCLAGILTGLAVVKLLLRSPPTAMLFDVLESLRVSVLTVDVNAAGSYFALLLVAALVVGVRRRQWLTLAVAVPLLSLGFIAAQSRAAMAAVTAVVSGTIMLNLGRTGRAWRMVVSGLAAVLLLAGALYATSQSHVALTDATAVRLQMTRVGLQMTRHFPVFGVGVGDYVRMSRRWITPDMEVLRGFAPRGENAHNNFLQVMAELGIPALLVFIYMTGSVALLGWRRRSGPVVPEVEGLSLGIAAFLLSALFGHPLLVSQVGALFWLAMGIAASGAPPLPLRRSTSRYAVAAAVLFYVVSLLWRLS
ncbi:MAG: O-antigen ligase family protein [Vicinamibacterales bacterium]